MKDVPYTTLRVMPKVDYDQAYADKLKLNHTRMISEISSGHKDILEKIEKRIGMYRLKTKPNDILKSLQKKVKKGLTDEEVISVSEWAAVKPERQNLHEMTALAALQKVYGNNDIVKLPTRGRKSIFFKDNNIHHKKPDTDSKSIDFKLEIIGKGKAKWVVYVGHKFTQNVGGKQTQQNVEPDRDMRNAPKKANVLFISIKDGPGAGATLSASVDKYETPGKIYACKIEDFDKIIDDVVKAGNSSFSLKGKY
jgi:hypothetical protein